MKDFYTCAFVSTGPNLIKAGATPVELSYTYEVTTPLVVSDSDNSGDNNSDSNGDENENWLNDAITRVQSQILFNLAKRTGLTDCVVIKRQRGSWRGLRDDGEGTRRRLIPRERGSTSIVGLGFLPGDVVGNATCSSDTSTPSSNSNSFWTEEEINELPEEFLTSGTVEDESTISNSSAAADLLLLNNTSDSLIIDGKMKRSINPPIQSRSIDNQYSNDMAEIHDMAFNFLSTQTETLSRSSFTRSHDPLVPRDSDMIKPRMSTRCSVVHGHVTLYTYDSDTYENLEARAIDAIKEDLGDETFVGEHFLNDLVLGVKFVGWNGTSESTGGDSINSSPGYVSSIIGAPAAASSTGSEKLDMFTFPVMILIALGAILVVLIALFVGTTKRKSRKEESFQGSVTAAKLRKIDTRDCYGGVQTKPSTDSLTNTSSSKDSTTSSKDSAASLIKDYGQEVEAEEFFSKYNSSARDIGSVLSRTFSGFSETGQTRGVLGEPQPSVQSSSVCDTYEVQAANNGNVRMQHVRSYVDQDHEDCYSIHSIRSSDKTLPPPSKTGQQRSFPVPTLLFSTDTGDVDTQFDNDGLSSKDSLRSSKTSPVRISKGAHISLPSPTNMLASRSVKYPKNCIGLPRLPSILARKKNDAADEDYEDDAESMMDDTFFPDESLIIDESTGKEVSLRPFLCSGW